ncbi:MAG: hypothetical protein OXH75_15665 [Acidobacteria bacterium]|nr:hypothetical protein [Acidobacteriota bacterium]
MTVPTLVDTIESTWEAAIRDYFEGSGQREIDTLSENVWPLVQGEVPKGAQDPSLRFPALVYSSNGDENVELLGGDEDTVEQQLLDFRDTDYGRIRALAEVYRKLLDTVAESERLPPALSWDYQTDGFGAELVLATGRSLTPRRVAIVRFRV